MVLLHDPPGNRQAKPRAPRPRRHEGLEDLAFGPRGDSRPVIAHFDDDLPPAPIETNLDRASFVWACLNRVLQQVSDREGHALRIDVQHFGCPSEIDAYALPRQLREGAIDELRGREWADVEWTFAHEVEEHARQPFESLGTFDHAFGLGPRRLGNLPPGAEHVL